MLVAFLFGCATEKPPATGPLSPLSQEERLEYLREAEVWAPIDTASLDLVRGPTWIPGVDTTQTVHCRFITPERPLGGRTPKFLCRDASGRTLKVKYGRDNPEVYGEVIGTRLLWALGFYTDRVDPVHVICRGCPEDPWEFLSGIGHGDPRPRPPLDVEREFLPATIENYVGERIQVVEEQGVSWPEILNELSRDPQKASQQRAHREALALLAGFLQHTDSKASNQTLSCVRGGLADDGTGRTVCRQPVLYIGDLGSILGRGWRVSWSKVDWEDWKSTEVWRDRRTCLARVRVDLRGTLPDTRISEAGRRFLADRLSRLSRPQIHQLFEMARVEALGREMEIENEGEEIERPVKVEDWVDLFQEKTREIIEHRCPESR